MKQRILYLFTRTPLHVGAGASVGAIDQPIIRERHTGFPVIPASSLKGSFADQWNDSLTDKDAAKNGKKVRVSGDGTAGAAAWLFGSDSDKHPGAGALIFSEARLLAFPVRSARGSFAWITCPLLLLRAKRDGVIDCDVPREPADDPDRARAIFKEDGPLALGVGAERQVVLEEYCFARDAQPFSEGLAAVIAGLVEDELFASVKERLVVVSNGMMSHFATAACEIAQHVRISDETGTAEGTGLFNQENVPSDTAFYSVVMATGGRVKGFQSKTGQDAIEEFEDRVKGRMFQFGGDASTGLGFCSVNLRDPKGV